MAVKSTKGKRSRRTVTEPTNVEDSNTATSTTSEEDTVAAEENGNKFEVKLVDELPKISRKVESGVWVERLAPLAQNPGLWHQIYGPTKGSPHAQVNNLRGGNAAGINPDDYEFSGRQVTTDQTDEDGKPVKEGYVFARLLTDEQKAERDEKKAKREAKKAEKEAANA